TRFSRDWSSDVCSSDLRVSIGRALLSQPRVLLMDEPLSALDRMAKDEVLPYFEALHANLKIPILLVTHDMSELERLADHVVLMRSEERRVGKECRRQRG